MPSWWSNPISAPKGAEGASGYAEACVLGLQLPDLGSGFQLLDFKSKNNVRNMKKIIIKKIENMNTSNNQSIYSILCYIISTIGLIRILNHN